MGDIWFDANHLEAWLGGQPVIHDLCLKLKFGESNNNTGAKWGWQKHNR